ncbi:MAG: sensor histidine kinase [Herpetosiphonaceae bacterium]|nr:sensor histidine kinase [Herpetosiphonaceae bacterium]
MRISWSLARQFLLASLLVLLVNGLLIGLWIGRQIEGNVIHSASLDTALFVESVVAPYLQPIASQHQFTSAQATALDRHFSSGPFRERIVAIKIWARDGTVLYSPNPQLIGQHFAIGDDLQQALNGQVNANMSDLRDPENVYERQHWTQLVQVYVPVHATTDGKVIGVAEFYQLPDILERDIAAARLRSWGVVIALTLATYLLLAGIVGRGSRTISNQQRTLNEKVVELSTLLNQNRSLSERVQQAAAHTTTLNEQALRRISADLHDGPGQTLGLALLRMDGLARCCGETKDFEIVQKAVQDALREIRSISAGLVLPELESLTVVEVVERAVREHERRSGIMLQLNVHDVPEHAPLPVTITLFRSLQEALSNATRHAGGIGVMVRVWTGDHQLYLAVSDEGPGLIDTPGVERPHLGVAGMRERAQMLGGRFQLHSEPGQGTTVNICWPLPTKEEAWNEDSIVAVI